MANGEPASESIIGVFKPYIGYLSPIINLSFNSPINPPIKISAAEKISVKIADGIGGSKSYRVTLAYVKIAAITDPQLVALEADLVAMDAAIDSLIAAVPAAVLAEVIEEGKTLKQFLSRFHAALAGKTTGGGTLEYKFKNIAADKDRITATVDANKNRTDVVFDDT